MINSRVGFLVLALVFAVSTTARAANVTPFSPQTLVSAIQNAGYKASLTKNDDGDPLINTAADGSDFWIYLSGCEKNKSCYNLEFVGLWNCAEAIKKCQEVADETNKNENPLKVMITNEGKTAAPFLYMFLYEGGISEELFIRNFEKFSFYNRNFSDEVSKK